MWYFVLYGDIYSWKLMEDDLIRPKPDPHVTQLHSAAARAL